MINEKILSNDSETDILLPELNNNNFSRRSNQDKKYLYYCAYLICEFFLKKIKIIWNCYIKNFCGYFQNNTVENKSCFPIIATEINYEVITPHNIIFWGNTNEEEVFFTDTEQIYINSIKERIKKSN